MKNFRSLSKAEMKKVMGGTSYNCLYNSDCVIGEVCDGLNHVCIREDETLVNCYFSMNSGPGCIASGNATFPSSQNAQNWCNNDPCCQNVSC